MKATKKISIVVAGAVAALALGSFATAAIIDGNGVIHGCYDKASGQLRVTDTATNQPKGCSAKEAALAWSQQGPAGPQGPKGDPGPSNAAYWADHDLQAVNVNTPVGGILSGDIAGSLTTAKLVIGTTNNTPTVATCGLYAGNDLVDTSSAVLYNPNGAAWSTLALSGYTKLGNAHVVCSAQNGFVRDVVITATTAGHIDFVN